MSLAHVEKNKSSSRAHLDLGHPIVHFVDDVLHRVLELHLVELRYAVISHRDTRSLPLSTNKKSTLKFGCPTMDEPQMSARNRCTQGVRYKTPPEKQPVLPVLPGNYVRTPAKSALFEADCTDCRKERDLNTKLKSPMWRLRRKLKCDVGQAATQPPELTQAQMNANGPSAGRPMRKQSATTAVWHALALIDVLAPCKGRCHLSALANHWLRDESSAEAPSRSAAATSRHRLACGRQTPEQAPRPRCREEAAAMDAAAWRCAPQQTVAAPRSTGEIRYVPSCLVPARGSGAHESRTR